jgi:hypothetical protein
MEETVREAPLWSTIGEVLKRRKASPVPQVSRVDWLAKQMANQTGDQEGIGCYRVIAVQAQESVIFEALSLLKEARRDGGVRKPGALFVSTVRRLCNHCGERHGDRPDGMKSVWRSPMHELWHVARSLRLRYLSATLVPA